MRPEKLMFSGGNVLKNGRSKGGFGLDFGLDFSGDFCSRLLRFIGALFGGIMNGAMMNRLSYGK
ncbi:hypothetical protein NMD15_14415 [Plesiomonas shigelloides]|uniref:hypothetical protein n=1 Tax=Plesiomonas shigelloides TaxID=703 RepID=UPI00351D2D5C